MDKRRTAIAFCSAALVILIGILAFQGIRQPSQTKTENISGAALALSDSGLDMGAQTAGESDAGTVAAISGSQQADRQKGELDKKSSSGHGGGQKTPSPVTQDKSAREKSVKTKNPSKPDEPSETEKTAKPERKPASKKASSSERDTKIPQTAPDAATPEPSQNGENTGQDKETERQVRLTIQCTAILDHRELWKDGLEEILPDNGIFYTGDCSLTDGDTVYDVLKRVCQEKNIALDSQYTPIYGTYYIQGIGNLYEFDCGSESGWKYSVNGKVPVEGCSTYQLSSGDEIVFYYDYKL